MSIISLKLMKDFMLTRLYEPCHNIGFYWGNYTGTLEYCVLEYDHLREEKYCELSPEICICLASLISLKHPYISIFNEINS